MEEAIQVSESGVGAPAPERRFRHFGQASELFAITLVNLLLKVVTLGVYHFWAKTRVRRYVWSQTSYQGERFEYTGRGIELLKGFGFALVVFAPLVLIFGSAQFFPEMFLRYPALFGLLNLPAYIFLLFLIGFARFSARRYKLSRTRWRGIRFALSGSAKGHGMKNLGYSLLTGITFGIYTPYMRNNLTANLISNMWFGDQQFKYQGVGGGLVRRFWGFVGLSFVFGIVGVVAIGALQVALMTAGQAQQGGLGSIFQIIGVVIGLLIYLPWAIAWLWFRAGEIRYYVANTSLAGMRFRMDFETIPFIWLWISNVVVSVITLGLAYPWVVVRSTRFICEHLHVEGELDFASIGQSPLDVQKSGEGLAEVLDLGGI